MSSRDKRALAILALAAVVSLAVYYWPAASVAAPAVGMYQSIPQAEQRLERLRRRAAQLPSFDTSEKKLAGVVAEREVGLLKAGTAAQAQALLLQVVRRVCDAQSPAVEIRSSSFGQPRPANDFYGEISVAINFSVRIDQLVNLLSELATQPELTALDRITLGQVNSEKQKLIPVQIVITGLVPRNLVPEQEKGLARF